MIDDAYAAAKDKLQQSAYERAVIGTKQTRKFYDKQGRVTSVLEQTMYETSLTIKMLEAPVPETYRLRQQLTGFGGAPIQIDISENKHLAATVQKLLNENFRLKEALATLIESGIPKDRP
jgi:hypothetical protein